MKNLKCFLAVIFATLILVSSVLAESAESLNIIDDDSGYREIEVYDVYLPIIVEEDGTVTETDNEVITIYKGTYIEKSEKNSSNEAVINGYTDKKKNKTYYNNIYTATNSYYGQIIVDLQGIYSTSERTSSITSCVATYSGSNSYPRIKTSKSGNTATVLYSIGGSGNKGWSYSLSYIGGYSQTSL